MSYLPTQETEGGSVGLGSSRPTVTIPSSEDTWQLVDRQKRQRTSPDVNPSKRALPKDYWLGEPIPVSNRFDKLPPPSLEDQTKTSKNIYKCPPIFVSGVVNITPLLTALDSIAKGKYSLKLLPKEEVKIQANESSVYNPILDLLKSKNTQFYTFKRKEDRAFKVMLRNMHPQVDVNEISQALELHGHKVVRIYGYGDGPYPSQTPPYNRPINCLMSQVGDRW